MKPDYRLPSMAEIAATRPRGLTAISTFSGCGGSSLGYRMAGYTVRAAVEFVHKAASTYHANFPETPIDVRDIRQIQGRELLELAGLERGELDLLDGSPPCSSFSVCGNVDRDWGREKSYSTGKVQRTDDLFPEFIRLIEELQPRAFIAENVPGMARGRAMGYYFRLRERLDALPYRVDARVVKAHMLGVPQYRDRLIFVGVREDLHAEPVFPKPLPYTYTLGDACPWQREPGAGEPPPPLDTDHLPKPPQIKPSLRWHYAVDWPLGLSGPRIFQFTRARPDRPIPTIAASLSYQAAGPYPPWEPRQWHLSELRLLCGFPADFVLVGSYQQQAERLGRAVPPPVSFALGDALADSILDRRTADAA